MSERRLTYSLRPAGAARHPGPMRGGQAAVLAAEHWRRSSARPLTVGRRGAARGALVVAAWRRASPRLAGAPREEWVSVAALFAARRGSGRAAVRSPAPTAGRAGSTAREPAGGAQPAARAERLCPGPPRTAARASGSSRRPTDSGRIGVLRSTAGRRLTAVLACRVLAFSLLDPEAQERRLARWGLVLSGAGGIADQAPAVDRADRARPGRRARALGPCRA